MRGDSRSIARGSPLHREGSSGITIRKVNKVVEKRMWYKRRRSDEDEKEEEMERDRRLIPDQEHPPQQAINHAVYSSYKGPLMDP